VPHLRRLDLVLAGLPFVMLGIHQLGEDLSGMAARVEVIGMCDGFAFAPLLSTVRGEDVLVVSVVEVLVLVKVRLRHSSRDWILRDARRKQVAARQRKRKTMSNNHLPPKRINSILITALSPSRVYICHRICACVVREMRLGEPVLAT